MLNNRTVLIVGSGRCGLASLAEVLNRQPGTKVSVAEPPLLPWKRTPGERLIPERLARLRRARGAGIVGDAASFYLPYLEDALAEGPELRVVGLRRPREAVVASFARFLDEQAPYPTNHWANEPGVGWHHDPIWTRAFPQYDLTDREEGVRRYWDEYYGRLGELCARHPQNVRVFEMDEALNTEAGQRAVLDFIGYPADEPVLTLGARASQPRPSPSTRRARPGSNHPLDPGKCVVLVPYTGFIFPPCEQGLHQLERRGYTVRRVGGYAAIDQGRNQMATDALIEGFEETMWIDSDVEFSPDGVDQLRAHGVPISCGIYPQKGRRALACHVMPGATRMGFGRSGGLQEVLYAGAGFLHVRRQVYLTIQHRLGLPLTNQRFGAPMIPFFYPMLHPIEDGYWYLAEDYAFCQRARECGYKVLADTSIRLWHHGTYPYGWEDSGIERERSASFTLHFPDPKAGPSGPRPLQ
jgi:hypothetical protein